MGRPWDEARESGADSGLAIKIVLRLEASVADIVGPNEIELLSKVPSLFVGCFTNVEWEADVLEAGAGNIGNGPG